MVSGYTLGCLPSGAPYSYTNTFTFNGYNSVLLFGDVGKTHYNSMQLKAETKSPKYGLYALALTPTPAPTTTVCRTAWVQS